MTTLEVLEEIPMASERSQSRFAEYRRRFREARAGRQAPAGGPPRRARDEPRSMGRLLVEFYKLLVGYRRAIGLSLTLATVATLLALLPPVATKLAIDNVLAGKPLEEALDRAGSAKT